MAEIPRPAASGGAARLPFGFQVRRPEAPRDAVAALARRLLQQVER